MTTTTATPTTPTVTTCRECDAPLDLSTRRAYSELYGSHSLMRLADELADVLERDPKASADEVMLRAMEHWLGCDVEALVAAVKHRQSEGYSS